MIKSKNKKRIKVLIISVILILFLFYLKKSLENTVIKYAETEAKNIMNKVINESVVSVLEKHSVKYKDIANINYDPYGNISSVTINTAALNVVRSETVISVMNELVELKQRKYKIPIGTVLGTSLFSNRGFSININVVPLGTVGSDVRNEFVSSGINQTLHRVMLDIATSVNVLAPFSKASSDVKASICIAETVIIGKVPDTYLNYTN